MSATSVIACHECRHPINEHLSTESSGEDGGGLNGCEHVEDAAFADEEFCRCYLTPNDIAVAALGGQA